MKYSITLPWPPSINHYYRHVGPRVLISKDGRQYREKVVALVRRQSYPTFTGPVSLTASFFPPDRRRRDLDNVGGKALMDTLQAAGLIQDDCQIKRIRLEMKEPQTDGLCCITLENIDEGDEKHGESE